MQSPIHQGAICKWQQLWGTFNDTEEIEAHLLISLPQCRAIFHALQVADGAPRPAELVRDALEWVYEPLPGWGDVPLQVIYFLA